MRLRHSVGSHRLLSIQRVKARSERSLIEQVHQAVKPFRCISRRQSRYPAKYRVRRSMSLCCTHDISLRRAAPPRVLPSTGVTPLHRYYDPSDFLSTVSASSPTGLVLRYCAPSQSTQDLPRSPVCCGYMPCSQTPVMCRAAALYRRAACCLLAFRDHRPSLKAIVNGAQSLQPEGLRPAPSLSTPDRCRCRHRPKTRYWVWRVIHFPGGTSTRKQTGASWRTGTAI